jgi:hypothetical protein
MKKDVGHIGNISGTHWKHIRKCEEHSIEIDTLDETLVGTAWLLGAWSRLSLRCVDCFAAKACRVQLVLSANTLDFS